MHIICLDDYGLNDSKVWKIYIQLIFNVIMHVIYDASNPINLQKSFSWRHLA